VALELLRRRVAGDTERRLAGDLLAAVLAGELCGAELERRLQRFGLGERVATLVVGCEGRERSEEALWTAVRAQGSDGLVARSGALACALVPDPGSEPELFEFAERVAERLEAHLGTPARLGVGRALAAGEARRSFHEARCALEAGAIATGNGQASTGNGQARTGNGKHVGEHSRIATYRDLGAFQLLLALQGDEALRLYCDSLLCPLESGEGHYGGELVRSLEVFIEENGQWERAARRLYCHRHTLRYRIRRIEELTGRDLSGARDRIEFWLAIRGRELVS
jgi:purine catabolism regulator